MPRTHPHNPATSGRVVDYASVRSTVTPFLSARRAHEASEFDGGLRSTYVIEGPYSLTTCMIRRVPDGDGDGCVHQVAELIRRFVCTPFGTLVLEPAARTDPWFEGSDATRFDALTWARDTSPLPLRPFMRDFDANHVGRGTARFFGRLAMKQTAAWEVHGDTPLMAEIPYGLREAVLHACGHDDTGVLTRAADESPKALVAIGACIGDRPVRWVTPGADGMLLAAPLAQLVAGVAHEECVASALAERMGHAVDERTVDDLLFLAQFVTSGAPDQTWLVARALLGFDRRDVPTRRDASAWSAWLRTLRPQAWEPASSLGR